MVYNNNIKIIKTLLKITILFILFISYFSLNFAVDYTCLENKLENNSIYKISQTTVCEHSSFNFSNLENLTIDCENKNTLYSDLNVGDNFASFEFYNVEDLTFKNCKIDYLDVLKPTLDNSNVKVNFVDCIFNSANNFSKSLSSTKGNYNFLNTKEIIVKDHFGSRINEFKIDLSSVSVPFYKIIQYNNSFICGIYSSYSNGVYSSYNPFNLNVSSEFLGGYNYTSNIKFDTNSINIGIKDINKPNVLDILEDISNDFLNFTIIFDEFVSGSLDVRNSDSNKIIKTFDVNYKKSFSISVPKSSLNYGQKYDIKFDINDMSGNKREAFSPKNYYFFFLNLTKGSNDKFSYLGNPQNTRKFNFWSDLYDIELSYDNPINLSNDINLSKDIVIRDNFVSVNSSSRFNDDATIYFKNLNYQTQPFILRGDDVCPDIFCVYKNYSYATMRVNVSNLGSNYSLISNSLLNLSEFDSYIGKKFLFKVNFSRTNDSVSLENANCRLRVDTGGFDDLVFNSSSGLFERELFFEDVVSFDYFVDCDVLDYDDKVLSGKLDLEYQIIDDFKTVIIFDDLGSQNTKTKKIGVRINSQGDNNVGDFYDTRYYFMFSKDYYYDLQGWNTTKKLSDWVDIGKNEFFEVFNNGEDFTSYRLENGSVGNFSDFIFIDEGTASGNGASLYVTVKACVPGGFCKFYGGENNYIIFEDITPPELFFVNVSKFYPFDDKLNFSFGLRDLESKVDSAKYDVILNSSLSYNFNENLPFVENDLVSLEDLDWSFEEGMFYKIFINAKNRVDKSSVLNSSEFLVDTIAPVNVSIAVKDNLSFFSYSFINFSLDPGFDFQENYLSSGLVCSGLDYMKIFVRDASFVDGSCMGWSDGDFLNLTLSVENKSLVYNFTSGLCYNVSYLVYDRAGNFKRVNYPKIVKVDSSKPELGFVSGTSKSIIDFILDGEHEYNIDNINKDYSELSEGDLLFKVKYNIFDNQSDVDFYNIELVNNNTGEVVAVFENYTSDVFDVNFNSSFFNDYSVYKVRVEAVNGVGLKSEKIETNGVSLYIDKVPELDYFRELKHSDSSGVLSDVFFDGSDDGVSRVRFFETNGFNVSCKVYEGDVGYDEFSGLDCVSFEDEVVCDFKTLEGENKFYVSCKNDDVVEESRTYNDENDNLDFKVVVEQSVAPFVLSVNSNKSFSSVFDVLENQSFKAEFEFDDNNSGYEFVGNFSFGFDGLLLDVVGSDDFVSSSLVEFRRVAGLGQPVLDVGENVYGGVSYVFSYDDFINYSQIIELSRAVKRGGFDFFSFEQNLSRRVNSSFFRLFLYEFDLLNYTFVDGFSNIVLDSQAVFNGFNFSVFNSSEKGVGVFLNSSDYNGSRRAKIPFSLVLSDGFKEESYDFVVNVSPVYYKPIVNLSFYGNNSFYEVGNVNFSVLNLSDYFFENNFEVGLSDDLNYSVDFLFDVFEVESLDEDKGVLRFRGKPGRDGLDVLNVSVLNVANQSNFVLINFSVPSYVQPFVNLSFLSFNQNLTLFSNKDLFLNLSDYFFENNSGVGLVESLSFNVSSFKNVKVLDFNETGFVRLRAVDEFEQSSFLEVEAKSVSNLSSLVRIDFNVSRFNVVPSLSVSSPVNLSVIDSYNKLLDVELSSDHSLKNISLVLNNKSKYVLCSSDCRDSLNLSDFVFPDLSFGLNNLTFEIYSVFDNFNSESLVVNFTADTDSDGVSDFEDDDIDGDGLLDELGDDKIIGVQSSFFSNLHSSRVEVNGSMNLFLNYTDVLNVSFGNSSFKFAQFEHNFSKDVLDLRYSSLIVDRDENDNFFMIFNGFKNLKQKVAFLPIAKDQRFSSVCVKDAKVLDISSVSLDCQADNEFLIDCKSGDLVSGFSCVRVNQSGNFFWKVSGLSHSGVRILCTQNWSYSNWSSCVDGVERRTAFDLNDCGLFSKRASLSRSCGSSGGGGGSSGGSSGGGGSSSSSNDESQGESGENSSVVNQSSQGQEVEIQSNFESLVLFGEDSKIFLNLVSLSKNYNLSYLDDFYLGVFVEFEDKLVFRALNSSKIFFEFSRDFEKLDLNLDGDFDVEVGFFVDESKFYLQSREFDDFVLIENQSQSNVTEQSDVDLDDSLSFGWKDFFVILGGFLVFLGVCFVLFVFYKRFYNDSRSHLDTNLDISKDLDKELVDSSSNQDYELTWRQKADRINSNLEQVVHSKENNSDDLEVVDQNSFDEIVEDLYDCSQILKKVVFYEKDLFKDIREESRYLVRKGISWSSIYFYLKSKDVSDFFIRKIVDFDYLADLLKDFYFENKVRDLSNKRVRELILEQDWISECYMLESDANVIITDLLYMLSEANVYGFSKKKCLKILNDEFNQGLINLTNVGLVYDFDSLDLDVYKINQVLKVQSRLEKLGASLDDIRDFLSEESLNVDLKSKENLLDLISQIRVNIDLHLQ